MRHHTLEVSCILQSQFHSSSCSEEMPWRYSWFLPESPNPLLGCQQNPTVCGSKISKIYFFYHPDSAILITGLGHSSGSYSSYFPSESRPGPKCDVTRSMELALCSFPRLPSCPGTPRSPSLPTLAVLLAGPLALPVFVLAVFLPCMITPHMPAFLSPGPLLHHLARSHSAPPFFLLHFSSSEFIFS